MLLLIPINCMASRDVALSSYHMYSRHMFPAFAAKVVMLWEENEHEKAKYLHNISVYSNREHGNIVSTYLSTVLNHWTL